MHRPLIAAVLLSLAVSIPAAGQSRRLSRTTEDDAFAARKTHAIEAGDVWASACPSTPLRPPATVTGVISLASCQDILGLREDVYAITVSAGTTLNIDYQSREFEVFLYMYLGNGTSIRTTRVSNILSSTVSRVTASHTFAASGTYYLEAESLFSYPLPTTLPWQGAYTLTVTTGGTPPPADPCDTAISLPIGVTTSGSLASSDCHYGDAYADQFTFVATKDEPVTVTYNASFAPYVEAMPADGLTGVWRRRESSGPITFTYWPEFTGLHRLILSTDGPSTSGGYSIRVDEVELEPCGKRRAVRK